MTCKTMRFSLYTMVRPSSFTLCFFSICGFPTFMPPYTFICVRFQPHFEQFHSLFNKSVRSNIRSNRYKNSFSVLICINKSPDC